MEKYIERNISEVFVYDGHRLITEEGSSCENCFFKNSKYSFYCSERANEVGQCLSTCRKDGKSVIYRELSVKEYFEKLLGNISDKEFENMLDEIKNSGIPCGDDAPETIVHNVVPPVGYEIDEKNSTLSHIQFKRIIVPWRFKNPAPVVKGYYLAGDKAEECGNLSYAEVLDVFVDKKSALSAIAMAQITQIMANDERFGGIITEDEWETSDDEKHIIYRVRNDVLAGMTVSQYHLLAFHTTEQRDLFLKENKDLIMQYFMLDNNINVTSANISD